MESAGYGIRCPPPSVFSLEGQAQPGSADSKARDLEQRLAACPGQSEDMQLPWWL